MYFNEAKKAHPCQYVLLKYRQINILISYQYNNI